MPVRPRGQLVKVTAQLIRDNPYYTDFLSDKLGHYVTALRGSAQASLYHYPQHCPTCTGSPA